MRVLAFSDFHLFARRSRGEHLLPQIVSAVDGVDELVICGDLFDFRWSESDSIGHACERAELWLENLLRRITEKSVVYILGNHDGIEEFVPFLNALQERFTHFRWFGDYYRVGETLFLHGDIPMKSQGQSMGPRPYKVGETIKNRLLNHLYDVITVTRTVNLYRKCVDANRKIPFLIEALKRDSSLHGVSRMVFGHSHHAFDSREFEGISCVNLGTGVVGYRFNPQVVEV